MVNVNLYLDTRRVKANGTYPVKVRVYFHRDILLPAGVDVAREAWDGSRVTKADRARNEKNARLDMLLSRVRAAVFSFEMDGTIASMDARSLSARLRRVMEGGPAVKPFAAYMEEVMETKVKASTRDSYAGTLAKLRAWDASCTFREMDRAWLAAFDAGMERSGLKPNSRAVHLRNLRAVFNYCIACGYTSLYPFRKFRLPHERTVKRLLSVERLRMLMSMEVEPWQEKYRDLFVLMFYLIGINAADLFPLPLPRGGRAAGVPPFQDGEALLGEGGAGGDGNHRKVQGQVVPLGRVRPGRELQGFHEADEQEPARAEPRGVRGDGGKEEEESARPPVPRLTSYWAQHTRATVAASLDIPKETISAALGHELGSPVTSVYIDFDRRKVDEANRRVIDYVTGKARGT